MLSFQLGFPSYTQQKIQKHKYKGIPLSHLSTKGHHQPPVQSISLNKTDSLGKPDQDQDHEEDKQKQDQYYEQDQAQHQTHKSENTTSTAKTRSPLSFINRRCRPDSPFHSFARPTGQKMLSHLTLKGRRREQRQTPQVHYRSPLARTCQTGLSTFFTVKLHIHAMLQHEELDKNRKKKKKKKHRSAVFCPMTITSQTGLSLFSTANTSYRPL